jgi:hypothetical protein
VDGGGGVLDGDFAGDFEAAVGAVHLAGAFGELAECEGEALFAFEVDGGEAAGEVLGPADGLVDVA